MSAIIKEVIIKKPTDTRKFYEAISTLPSGGTIHAYGKDLEEVKSNWKACWCISEEGKEVEPNFILESKDNNEE